MANTLLLLLLSLLVLDPKQSRITIDPSSQEFLLPINEIPILIDSGGQLTLNEVLDRQADFLIYEEFKPKDYCVDCAYWIKVPLRISHREERQWVLEFYDQTIDSISAYLPQLKGGYRREFVGDYFPFSQKPFAHKNFEWMINTEIVEDQDLYFRVKSHAYADIRLAIRTVNRFVYYSLNEYFLYGIFYGMIFIVSVYNILIFFAIKERKYLYYTFYIVSVFVYAMCIDGIAYQYLWPNSPGWNQIAYGTALFSLIFWALIFSKRFLNTRVRAPQLDRVLIGTIILRSLIFLYAFFFDHKLFEYRNVEIIPLTLIFYSSIHVWMKGYKPARFFVLAYGILFLGFLLKALLYLSIIPFVVLSYYSLHVCFLLEMLFLTFALSDRVRILKDNRDRALRRSILQHQENAELKDKVNRELEEKIKQRTQEIQEKNQMLTEANDQLESQKEDISQINSMLGLDNYKLRNNIKSLQKERILNKTLSYPEFEEVFSSREKCLEVLANHKWRLGYACKKCKNRKYIQGTSFSSRRCSKCGYNETATAGSLFHAIKFPLDKALYILYLFLNEKDVTLNNLSDELALRKNTIWAFQKKIQSHSLIAGPRELNLFHDLELAE